MPELDYINLQDQSVRINFQLLNAEIVQLKNKIEQLTSRVNELESI